MTYSAQSLPTPHTTVDTYDGPGVVVAHAEAFGAPVARVRLADGTVREYDGARVRVLVTAERRVVALRSLAVDFRATAAADRRSGLRNMALTAERLALRYDAQAATITAALRGPDVPPASFGPAWGTR